MCRNIRRDIFFYVYGVYGVGNKHDLIHSRRHFSRNWRQLQINSRPDQGVKVRARIVIRCGFFTNHARPSIRPVGVSDREFERASSSSAKRATPARAAVSVAGPAPIDLTGSGRPASVIRSIEAEMDAFALLPPIDPRSRLVIWGRGRVQN